MKKIKGKKTKTHSLVQLSQSQPPRRTTSKNVGFRRTKHKEQNFRPPPPPSPRRCHPRDLRTDNRLLMRRSRSRGTHPEPKTSRNISTAKKERFRSAYSAGRWKRENTLLGIQTHRFLDTDTKTWSSFSGNTTFPKKIPLRHQLPQVRPATQAGGALIKSFEPPKKLKQ